MALVFLRTQRWGLRTCKMAFVSSYTAAPAVPPAAAAGDPPAATTVKPPAAPSSDPPADTAVRSPTTPCSDNPPNAPAVKPPADAPRGCRPYAPQGPPGHGSDGKPQPRPNSTPELPDP
ncbi:proline-rich receptor-like protein kinase PERK8 [Phragmites australis]|uniref:proline-rich receptor-like protein kinase PERK8 n=1 Tax=Phragmites australis TaxID=29695 RepID=UPI002D7A1C13|nr:proline-rich receptor-like protein kinase PERK8 [Phragmites australis]